MSGPKDYSPPPRYSINVFNGKLNNVLKLQTQLNSIAIKLSNYNVVDKHNKIEFNCKNDLEKIAQSISKALIPLVFDYTGEFGQNIYNEINNSIDQKISNLSQLIDKCTIIENDFKQKEIDYKTYIEYSKFYSQSNKSLEDFKEQLIAYFRNNIEPKLPELFTEASDKIKSVIFTLEKESFSFGFSSNQKQNIDKIVAHIEQQENSISSIRSSVSSKVIATLQNSTEISTSILNNPIVNDEETSIIIKKIKKEIFKCNDENSRKEYKKELDNLLNSSSLKNCFYYKQLFDSIVESEKTRLLKQEANTLIAEINSTQIHCSNQQQVNSVLQSIILLLNRSSIKQCELDDLKMKFDNLVADSNKNFEEEDILRKEHLFLKSQVVLCLENLGYEVMDDLEVIDFEKENDYLLKIKGQDNYLNLKFKEDGSLRYVFQIPEEVEELSTDQENMKLHEMQVTCNDFKTVLKDLEKMGLKLNLKSEKPVSIDSMISVTKKQRSKIATKTKSTQHKQQLKKKYLNH